MTLTFVADPHRNGNEDLGSRGPKPLDQVSGQTKYAFGEAADRGLIPGLGVRGLGHGTSERGIVHYRFVSAVRKTPCTRFSSAPEGSIFMRLIVPL